MKKSFNILCTPNVEMSNMNEHNDNNVNNNDVRHIRENEIAPQQ